MLIPMADEPVDRSDWQRRYDESVESASARRDMPWTAFIVGWIVTGVACSIVFAVAPGWPGYGLVLSVSVALIVAGVRRSRRQL